MTFIGIYLLVYGALVTAAVVSLWYTGVLGQLPASWVATALLVAIGLGVLAYLAFRPPAPAAPDRADPV